MSVTRELIEALEQTERAQEVECELTNLRAAIQPIATLLTRAESLLAEGQHGPCDADWRRKVRDYFSQHQRGEVVGVVRKVAR